MSETIIKAIEDCLGKLKKAFEDTPTLFYTETDLVCWFTADLHGALGANAHATDCDGKAHRLVHSEYPTPFRCEMANGGFEQKSDEDCARDKRRYGRGHLDVVVMNPDFVGRFGYHLLKAQDYDAYKTMVLGDRECPTQLLYAVEFLLSRDEIKQSRGPDKTLAAHRCAKAIFQDAAKLDAARSFPCFVLHTRHVAFLKGTGEAVRTMIRDAIGARERIDLVFAD